jgi:GH24 family phage-related lysozyme (muramidase)
MPGIIKVNPSVFEDKRDALAVAYNEAIRLMQEDMKFTPIFEVTPEQKAFFKNTAYATDSQALKRTIISRIATHDTSVSPTPEQESETVRLLALVMELIGPKHPDFPTVQKMAESVKAGGARGEVRAAPAPETPVEEGGAPMEQQGVPETVATQAADAAGDVRAAAPDYTDAIGYTLAMLKQTEGFDPVAAQHRVDKPNPDGSIPWTVGHGITQLADGTKIKAGDKMDQRTSLTRAEEIIVKNLIPEAEKNVAGWDKLDPRLQGAMLETAYNVGPRYFQDIPKGSPKMLARFRKGEEPATILAEENATWRKANGVILDGLVKRRALVKEKLIDTAARDAAKKKAPASAGAKWDPTYY